MNALENRAWDSLVERITRNKKRELYMHVILNDYLYDTFGEQYKSVRLAVNNFWTVGAEGSEPLIPELKQDYPFLSLIA